MQNRIFLGILILISLTVNSTVQSMDKIEISAKFKILNKLIENAVDQTLSLDSQEIALSQTQNHFTKFSELEIKDFFNHLIEQRLEIDATPEDYAPDLGMYTAPRCQEH